MTADILGTLRAEIDAHALAEFPREACGLAIVQKGRHRYVPCRNVAESPAEHFQLSAEDYAHAEDRGEIVAVVHSHPNAWARASEADRVACETSGLPWIIVGVRDDGTGPFVVDVDTIAPCGFEAPLVGRAFVHGVLDCYTLVRDHFARELSIALPDFPRTDKWWERGDDLYMRHFAEAGFVPATGALRPHDVILMQIRTPGIAQVDVNHAAVYLGDGAMVHHLYQRLSSRDVYGGYWAENTRLIIRHKELTDA